MAETTYRANCHCGKFVYEWTAPEPLSTAMTCNCSICTKKAYVFAFAAPGGIKVVKGSIDDLTTYMFGGTYAHKFCGDCGSAVFCSSAKGMGLNIRCFQGPVDLSTLQISQIDAAATPPAYVEPAFTGTEPTGELRGDGTPTTYHGSCHCGAVRLALRSQPIDETLDMNKSSDLVIDCNCSICMRSGSLTFYAADDQVSIEDPDNNLKYYSFAKYATSRAFCGKCGIMTCNAPVHFTEEELAKLPESARTDEAKAWRAKAAGTTLVNLRVLYGVDLKKLPITHYDGDSKGEPKYVNP